MLKRKLPKQKTCKGCREKFAPTRPMQEACQPICAINIARAKADKKAKAERKEFKRETKRRKESIKSRTGKNGYYSDLQTEVNKYVKHVLLKGEPCYTCDLPQKATDGPQAFHCGHYLPKKMVDPRRFMVEGLRLQCLACNSYNSGRQGIYRERLIEEIGLDQVEWLECDANHPELKELFPHYSDIQKETARYRKLNKQIGQD